ncbi:formate dehydrogenase accessory sulfurtransferase FdhD [Mariniluteicoccus flavus]
MGRVTARHRITRIDADGGRRTREDHVVAEEPLEIRVNGAPLAVTMRTPGHDIELAHGFLATEGVIAGRGDVAIARYCAGAVVPDDDLTEAGSGGFAQNTYNVLDVALAPQVAPPSVDVTRNFYTTSSCGVCGKASIDAIRTQMPWEVADDPVTLNPAVLVALPDRLREHQRAFDRTGGLHAAGLFTPAGDLLVAREDVGRHNAVDKVIGWALLNDRLPLRGHVLVVSGRASFELTQKALMAAIPALVAVSAPSSLAVEVATEAGLTLLGFTRAPSANVYARPDRISDASSATASPADSAAH